MKKYIFSPLCSAFVVPGLGQILNQDIKKGLSILIVVFVLLVAAISVIINSLFKHPGINGTDSETLLKALQGRDLVILWGLLIAFAVVWVYSVLDAFWTGKRLESMQSWPGPLRES